ncbi:MAG: flagellar protein FlaG [Defluviitaleaceae bacterium]|nr:flagellar protein FlaG [Defluviitaleaceae bacterium]
MEANLQSFGSIPQASTAISTEPRRQNMTATPTTIHRPVESAPQPTQQPTVTMATPPSEVQATITLPESTPFTSNNVTDAYISRALETVNEALAPSHFSLNSSIHEATNTIMVRVIDTDTDEVIRELPPESRLDLLARIHEFAGLLVDVRT